MRKFLRFTMMLGLAGTALAEETMFVSLGYMPVNVSENVANEEGIDTKANAFDLGVGARLNYIRGDLYAGFVQVDDNESFTQTVISNGSVEEAESGASGFYIAAEIGPSHTISIVTVDLMAGWSKFLVSRSIDNCMDCDSESISIPASLYLKPQVNVTFPGTQFGGSVAYEVMTSGSGLKNSIRFGLTMSGGV